jgi:peroxiredoxin
VIAVKRHRGAVAAALLVASLLPPPCGVLADSAQAPPPQETPTPTIGSEPPDFVLPTPEGTEAGISGFRGKVILLSFCAGYLDTCCQLVRALNGALDRYEGQGIAATMVLSEMPTATSKSKCGNIKAVVGSRVPLLIDDGKRLKLSYKVTQLPTTFVIGRDYRIRDRVRGEGVLFTQEFRAKLESLLAERP